MVAAAPERAGRPGTLPPEHPRGISRVRTLWRLFRNEQTEPEPFYTFLAVETVAALERRHGSLAGQRIADVGCGPGYYSAALRGAGAIVVPVEGSIVELCPGGRAPVAAVIADAATMPLADASVDGVFCSNVLEHVPDSAALIGELARVLRPGGWGYLSYTNWYSPWGGHVMSPHHYLGPRLGPALYERRHGPPAKNRINESLFVTHIGPVLRQFAAERRVVVERVEPRYWPWAGFITKVPAVREVLTWNCVIHFRRAGADR